MIIPELSEVEIIYVPESYLKEFSRESVALWETVKELDLSIPGIQVCWFQRLTQVSAVQLYSHHKFQHSLPLDNEAQLLDFFFYSYLFPPWDFPDFEISTMETPKISESF